MVPLKTKAFNMDIFTDAGFPLRKIPKERITITCYLSTHTLSIQGSQHYKWTSTELVQDIGEKLTLNSSHSVASPLTSTPMISSPQLQANVSTQSLNLTPHIVTSSSTHANVEIQTEVITCSTGTQTDVSTTATFPDAPSSDSVIVDFHEEPTSTTPSKSDSVIIDIPAIPTSNLFSSLAVEDTTHDSEPEDGFPPLPLPNPIPKKCTSSPTRPATSPTKPATATECVITMPDEPSPPSPSSSDQTPGSPSQNSSSTQRKTIVIIGDSIPKYLVGRKMSRQYRVVNRCIPGSKLELWIQLAPIIITEEQPSTVHYPLWNKQCVQQLSSRMCRTLQATYYSDAKSESFCQNHRIIFDCSTQIRVPFLD